ncbi:MAG: hypothetical protein ACRDPY_36835 [Streptosporangiaceae bacterium]
MDLDQIYREEAARITAALAVRTGDVALAADTVQDAFIEAIEHWQDGKLPPNAGGWLATTASVPANSTIAPATSTMGTNHRLVRSTSRHLYLAVPHFVAGTDRIALMRRGTVVAPPVRGRHRPRLAPPPDRGDRPPPINPHQPTR